MLKTYWTPHKSKEQEILHRSYTPKKFPVSKNIFFARSKWGRKFFRFRHFGKDFQKLDQMEWPKRWFSPKLSDFWDFRFFSVRKVPSDGVPRFGGRKEKHRESTSYIPLPLPWKFYVNPSRNKKVRTIFPKSKKKSIFFLGILSRLGRGPLNLAPVPKKWTPPPPRGGWGGGGGGGQGFRQIRLGFKMFSANKPYTETHTMDGIRFATSLSVSPSQP